MPPESADRSGRAGSRHASSQSDRYRITRSAALTALWLFVPGWIWLAEFGPAHASFAGLLRVILGVAGVYLGLFVAVAIAPGPPRLGRVEIIAVTTTILHLAAGGVFLALLGPGIAHTGGTYARAALGALLILLAWTGWSILHPIARRIPLVILGRLTGRRGRS